MHFELLLHDVLLWLVIGHTVSRSFVELAYDCLFPRSFFLSCVVSLSMSITEAVCPAGFSNVLYWLFLRFTLISLMLQWFTSRIAAISFVEC